MAAKKSVPKAKSTTATAKTPKKMPAKTTAKPRPKALIQSQHAVARRASGATRASQTGPRTKASPRAIAPATNGSAAVDAYLRELSHPFKAEMRAVRAIILGASAKIGERIKWNAPSFYYKQDLGAFNPRASQFAHLILLFPDGLGMPAKSALLEGNHRDRREAKFYDLADVQAKRGALERLVKSWVRLRGN